MAHEILSIKLCQLDDRLRKLHSRIYLSETANHSQLRQEIAELEKECAETEADLWKNLQRSQSSLASILAHGYEQVAQIIQQSKERIQTLNSHNYDAEASVEEKLLLAEYALDFAHQAADRALLISIDAIDAQMLQQQEGRTL